MAKLIGELNGRYKTGLAGTRGIYTSWQGMKQRCLNPNHPKYHRYGGRGIDIHPDWLDIEGFKKWAESSGFKEGMTIDRVDNDGGYNPDNCHWISKEQNSRKKSTTKITLLQAGEIRTKLDAGESRNDLAKEYGVKTGTIWFIQNNITHVPDGECARKIKAKRNGIKNP